MTRRIPVSVERVLFVAAKDADFCTALLQDREAAVKARGYDLRPTELAMIRSASAAQLRAIIDSMDLSPENIRRRAFMRVVAAGAATIAAAEGIGCGSEASTGSRPDLSPDTGRPDGEGTPEAGGEPDGGVPFDSAADSNLSTAGTGIRPG